MGEPRSRAHVADPPGCQRRRRRSGRAAEACASCSSVGAVASGRAARHDAVRNRALADSVHTQSTSHVAASEGGHGAEQDAANWQHASTFYRQFDGAIEVPAALRVPAVLSTLAAVPLPGICGASWIPYGTCPPEGLGPSLHATLPPAREPMSDGGAPAGDSDAFTFPRLPVEERHQLRAACRREADSYCTAWNQSLRPAQVPGWSGAACPDSLLPFPRPDPARSRSQAACGRGGPTAMPVQHDRRSPDLGPSREPCAAEARRAVLPGTDDGEDPESSAAADVTVLPAPATGPAVSAAASRPPALAHHEAVSRPTPPRGDAGRRLATRQRRARASGAESKEPEGPRRRGARSQPKKRQPRERATKSGPRTRSSSLHGPAAP